MKTIFTLTLATWCMFVFAQSTSSLKGIIKDSATGAPIANTTIHILGTSTRARSREDGNFSIRITDHSAGLEISCVGYRTENIVDYNLEQPIVILMSRKEDSMNEITIKVSRKPGRSFMELVLAHKNQNDPSKIKYYNARKYARNELSLDNFNYNNDKQLRIAKSLIKAFNKTDCSFAVDRQLPVYFDEKLSRIFHSGAATENREILIAKKTPGLKTDNLIEKLDKFNLHFAVYDNWIPIFNQIFVSPLNDNAFKFYTFYKEDTLYDKQDTIVQIRFVPRRTTDRTFSGFMWINTATFAVQTMDLHLNKTVDLNYIRDINYREDFREYYDSSSVTPIQMPYKYVAEVKFESGLDLFGIPVSENKNTVKLLLRCTTVQDDINFGHHQDTKIPNSFPGQEQSETFWKMNRSDSLTDHEKNIYEAFNALNADKTFKRNVKLIAFAGTGYWDLGRAIRLGPYSSFISNNQKEGWRFRTGWWTMEGFSRRINFYGYGAYGTKDQKLKGLVGIKYIWDYTRWTKTTLSYGSDYDFIIDQDDEMDKDNMISSFLRKKVPFSRIYTRQLSLKHEQYISPQWSTKLLINYKTISPPFEYKFKPILSGSHASNDSVLNNIQVSEFTLNLRYAPNEKRILFNYDKISLGSFSPIINMGFTVGAKLNQSMFSYQKMHASIEQQLRLPPKSQLYYKLEAGKVLGTVPYLLMNVPTGSEYLVSSKYQYNTMNPYEFVADQYLGLHTRFQGGGMLFSKIPGISKLGWRERLTYNMYCGSSSNQNKEYNKQTSVQHFSTTPFIEAGAGIENIFHVLSVEYIRRLTYLNGPAVSKGGVYLGITLNF